MKEALQTRSGLLVWILTFGVFGILNTEMGVVGILPQIAETFHVTVPQAGWTVSAFALVVALTGPVMPLLCSGINRKRIMLICLGVFVLSNIVSMLTNSFPVVLLARILPAIFHPVYVSMAFTVASNSVPKEQAPKAVSQVFLGVSAGMVLGVPLTSLIASATNFAMAMLFFAVVNAVVLVATIFLVPSIPVTERLSYGSQLQILKKAITWHSLLAVIFINGGMFGFFSFLSDYLQRITGVSSLTISTMLFIYGGANILGNISGGRLLVQRPVTTIQAIPVVMIAAYVVLFLVGSHAVPTGAVVFVLGLLAGVASNGCQYMVTQAAPEAPDFANGLYLTSANLGTALGTAFCGLFIASINTRYAIMGTVVFLAIGIAFVLLRQRSARATPMLVVVPA